MKSNNSLKQMQRQQEQMRRQQMQGWAAEQEKKRKRRRRQADMLQTGGINITGVDDLDVGGDMVGRDKVSQVTGFYPRDEKSGFTLFIERGFAFVFALLVGGAIFGGIGAAVSSGSPIGIVIGVGIGVLFAFATASSISRYRD